MEEEAREDKEVMVQGELNMDRLAKVARAEEEMVMEEQEEKGEMVSEVKLQCQGTRVNPCRYMWCFQRHKMAMQELVLGARGRKRPYYVLSCCNLYLHTGT